MSSRQDRWSLALVALVVAGLFLGVVRRERGERARTGGAAAALEPEAPAGEASRAPGPAPIARAPLDRLGTPGILEVLVQDAAGAPLAGVLVAAAAPPDAVSEGRFWREAGLAGTFREERLTDWISAPRASDADGRAVFELPAEHERARLEARAFAPLLGVQRAERGTPGEPIVLVLPEHGALEATLRFPPGFRSGFTPLVAVLADGGLEREALVVPGERVRFDRVPLGGTLSVVALVGGVRSSSEVSVAAPRSPGECVRVELELEAPLAIRGRAIDEAGRPLGDRPLARLGPRAHPGPPGCGTARDPLPRTDRDGRFELEEPPACRGDELVLHLGGPDPVRRPQRIARVPLGGPPHAAVLELGDVVFVGEPLTVAGRVLDAAGGPASGARLRVLERIDGSGRMLPVATGVAVDADGRFELRGPPRSGALLVEAHLPGRAPARALEVRPGTDDLELVLE